MCRLPFKSTGGGGGRGRPAIGLIARLELLGFRGRVPILDGAGLGSALGNPFFFLELLGGATGPDPGISTLGYDWLFSAIRLMGWNM